VWFLRDNTWHSSPHDVAQEIVNSATTANVPGSGGDGVSLSDAITQNKATLTAKFVAQTAGHFYGDTTLEIKNTGTADLKVFMPVGTVFTVPNGGGKFQDLAAYALGVQGTQQAAPGTATPEPTMTAAPTATTAAAAPTATAGSSTVAATATAAPASSSGTLPQTGGAAGSGDSVPGLVALMFAVGLVVLGFVLRLKQWRS